MQRCLYSYRQRYSSSQWSNVVDSRGAAEWVHNNFDTVMKNIVVDKSTDNVAPLSICFLPQYSTPKKVSISERDQNHDSKKEQALSITFSQFDWCISQNGRSWLAITLRDKMAQAWRVQRCLDSHRQRQINQSDCEITSNCGKKRDSNPWPLQCRCNVQISSSQRWLGHIRKNPNAPGEPNQWP